MPAEYTAEDSVPMPVGSGSKMSAIVGPPPGVTIFNSSLCGAACARRFRPEVRTIRLVTTVTANSRDDVFTSGLLLREEQWEQTWAITAHRHSSRWQISIRRKALTIRNEKPKARQRQKESAKKTAGGSQPFAMYQLTTRDATKNTPAGQTKPHQRSGWKRVPNRWRGANNRREHVRWAKSPIPQTPAKRSRSSMVRSMHDVGVTPFVASGGEE